MPAPPSAVRDYRTGEGRGANPGRGVRVRVAGMVFENLLAPLLERFLGQYIVDLPREQLRVGVWSGVVRLENVRLKPAAFDHLKLPFAVREGTIGLVELKAGAQDGAPVRQAAPLRHHPGRHLGHRLAENGG